MSKQYLLTLTSASQSHIFSKKSLLGKYYAMISLCKKFVIPNELCIEPTRKRMPHIHILFTSSYPLNIIKLFVVDTFFSKLCDPFNTAYAWESKTHYKYPNAIEHTYSPAIKLTENFSNEVNYLDKDNNTGWQESMVIMYQQIKELQCSHRKIQYHIHNLDKGLFDQIPDYMTLHTTGDIRTYLKQLLRQSNNYPNPPCLRQIVFDEREKLIHRDNPDLSATENPRLKEIITL